MEPTGQFGWFAVSEFNTKSAMNIKVLYFDLHFWHMSKVKPTKCYAMQFLINLIVEVQFQVISESGRFASSLLTN